MATAHPTVADEEHHSHDEDGDASGKRRRVQRACDVCRKKKIRCDGLQPEKGACSNCASYGHECTFIDATKRRAPPRSYVIALEARMERAEKLITQLIPTIDLTKAIGPMPELPQSEGKKEGEEEKSQPSSLLSPTSTDRQHESEQSSLASQRQRLPFNFHRGESSETSNTTIDSWQNEDDDSEEIGEEEDAAFIRFMMDKVNITSSQPESIIAAFNKKGGREIYEFDNREDASLRSIPRPSITDGANDSPLLFYGKASVFHIVPHLTKMMKDDDQEKAIDTHSNYSEHVPSSSDFGLPDESEADLSSITFQWPAKDLEEKLIQIYFERANPQYPILNEIVFRKQIQKPNWKSNDNELILVALGVFATSSRYLTDPEIEVMPNLPKDGERWAYLLKHLLERGVVPISSKITYIQATLLCTIYIIATPLGFRSFDWISLGVVVRLLQDMGAHRKFTATSSDFTLLTEETYRRLWWCTYVLDRFMSADMGRPMSIQDEDIDLDDILVVDDRYVYEASERGIPAVQPTEKPSVYHGFLQMLRLTRIIGRTLRTIYAISKSKAERGFIGKKWDSYIVAEIDKSLNTWLESVPAHLAYSPSEVNTEWLIQSSRIFLIYYSTQALVHRPFVQRYKLASPLSFHSLAIVSNSARSGIHIMSNLTERGIGSLIGPEIVLRIFIFSSSLLLISYSAARKSYNVSSTLVGDVMKGLDSLKKLQRTWKNSKRFANRLQHVLKHTDLSTDAEDNPSGSNSLATGKRSHEDEDASLQQQQQQQQPFLQQNENLQQTRTREIRGIKSHTNAPEITTKLPLSTTELQGRFGNSPNSTLDQVAALSGWQQHDVGAINAQFSSLASSGISNPTTFAPVPNDASMNNMAANQTNFVPAPSAVVQDASQPIFNVFPELFMNNSAFGENATGMAGQPLSENKEDTSMLDPSRALRNDAFFGGSTSLLPTPGFELNPTMFNMPNGVVGSTYGGGAGAGEPQGSNVQQRQPNQVNQTEPLNGESATGIDSNININNNANSRITNDPLDALSNFNSFWSDSDWMRAIQNTQT